MDRLIEAAASFVALLIFFIIAWVLSRVIERFYEGWWWIGWIAGAFVGVGLVFLLVFLHTWVSDKVSDKKEMVRMKLKIHGTTLEKPGITHTELCRSLDGKRNLKESAIRALLRERQLKCEQKGRVRRYFALREDTLRT